MTTTLRRAGPADAPAVGALTRLAYAKWVQVIGREPKPMVADYDKAVVEHRIDLVEAGETLVALIETVLRADDLLIENIAVAPDQQGRGLGRRLLDHAEAIAREAGRTDIRLYTNERMATNIALYRRHGYATEYRRTNERGVIVHMVKRLEN